MQLDAEKIIAIPGAVRREFGWTGAKLRGAVKIIEDRLRDELMPVDPDLVEARKIAARSFRPDKPDDYLNGLNDDFSGVRGCLAAIKRGRELARSTPNDSDNREGEK